MSERAGRSDLTDGVAVRPQAGELAVGAVLAALAAFALTRIPSIPSPEGYSPAGPRFIPLVVCVIWLALALAYLAQAIVRYFRTSAVPDAVPPASDGATESPGGVASAVHRGDAPAGDPPVPAVPTAGAGGLRTLAAPAALIAVLVVYQWVLEPAGYIVATALAFVAAARVLGSSNLVRDVIVGIGLAFGIYFAFVYGLAIRLPEGVIPL